MDTRENRVQKSYNHIWNLQLLKNVVSLINILQRFEIKL